MSTRFVFTPIPPARNETSDRPAAVDALAGTWRGRLCDENGVTDTFTLLRDGSVDASVVGRFLFFSTPTIAPTGVRLLDANDRAFVALIGPYYEPRENADVVTVLEGIRQGSVIEGSFYTRLHNWRDTIRRGRFTAKRVDSAHRAA
jgi:hypothetical protein